MFLSNALDQGLDLVPTCKALCLVDISAGLVLGKSSINSTPQEQFDKMADCAATLFSDGLGLIRLSAKGELDQFSVYGQTGLQIYVRAPNEPDHVLCYQCDLTGNVTAIVRAVRSHTNNVAEFLLES